MNSVTPLTLMLKLGPPMTKRVIPSVTPGVASPQYTVRMASKPDPPVAGERCTLIAATPPSEPAGRTPPPVLKPPGMKPMNSTTVHVPNAIRAPPEVVCRKEPLPVAFPDSKLNDPDPDTLTLSPLAEDLATSGQGLDPTTVEGSVHKKPLPTRN